MSRPHSAAALARLAATLGCVVIVGVAMSCGASTPQASPVTVAEAISKGCASSADLGGIIMKALAAPELGTTTQVQLQALEAAISTGNKDEWMTVHKVTDPNTWLYRATDSPKEARSLEGGKLMSKALRQTKGKKVPPGFWETNGPRLQPRQRNTSLWTALQVQATVDSSAPISQFSSVAIDYEVASRFGHTIYSFQANPDGPVLGLQNCATGGETQFQIKGGTPIRNLERFVRTLGYWETYDATYKRWRRRRREFSPQSTTTNERVVCSVFDDSRQGITRLSSAIYVAAPNLVCIPDGTPSGTCRKWFGDCQVAATGEDVVFKVFNDGPIDETGYSRAVYFPGDNSACTPDNTPEGGCRRWFGLGASSSGRSVECFLFNDGPTDMVGPTTAIYFADYGQVCMPDGTSQGTCRKWFGECRTKSTGDAPLRDP